MKIRKEILDRAKEDIKKYIPKTISVEQLNVFMRETILNKYKKKEAK
jgi:hypothetical protein